MSHLFHHSLSKIVVYPSKNAQALIDEELVKYYNKLTPKYFGAHRPSHKPHITFVREWEVESEQIYLDLLRFNGVVVNFYYGPNLVYKIGRHFVIDCFSEELEKIRELCGLSKHRSGFDCFHFTIGYTDE